MKPVAVRGRCFKRSGSVTRQMTSAEIAEVHLQCTGQSPDARTIDGKTIEDIDLARVQLYMTRAVIEQYGSGTGRVLNACNIAGLPEPEFGNYSGGFRILFKPQKTSTPPVTPPVKMLLLLVKEGCIGVSSLSFFYIKNRTYKLHFPAGVRYGKVG